MLGNLVSAIYFKPEKQETAAAGVDGGKNIKTISIKQTHWKL